MTKNYSYFSHDSNARNSDKLIPVRMKYGAAGYGVYFMILERLRDEKDYMSVKDYNIIAFDLRVDASLIKSIVEDFGLFVFTDDGEYFYSESFLRRMKIKDNEKIKRSEAGKKAALARWEKESDANSMRSHCNRNTVAMQSKVKESKVKQSKAEALEHAAAAFEPTKSTDEEFEQVKRHYESKVKGNLASIQDQMAITAALELYPADFIVMAMDQIMLRGKKITSFAYFENVLADAWEVKNNPPKKQVSGKKPQTVNVQASEEVVDQVSDINRTLEQRLLEDIQRAREAVE